MQSLVANGTGDVKPGYTGILTKASASAAMVDENNLVLAEQLSQATVTAIRAWVDRVSATAANGPIDRVGIAILLTLASPDYLTLRLASWM